MASGLFYNDDGQDVTMDVLSQSLDFDHNLCFFCQEPLVIDSEDTWKQVEGWVGGPKRDSMRLRQDTGNYAHHGCVQKVVNGMPPEQHDLFEENQ